MYDRNLWKKWAGEILENGIIIVLIVSSSHANAVKANTAD
jgi:hypothetical protein